MRFSTATPVSLSFSLFACFLYACHLMQRCLNCQSNFRLKVFLLFLIPTAVSFFVYSFFCFSHASVLPDFLNWLLLCLLYTCHLMQRCVPVVVFQQSCSNSRVSASTFQHVSLLCCSICVRFQQSCFSQLQMPQKYNSHKPTHEKSKDNVHVKIKKMYHLFEP
jgi:hypothetical protein